MHPVLQVAKDYLLTLSPLERVHQLFQLMQDTTDRTSSWRYLDRHELVDPTGLVVGFVNTWAGRHSGYVELRWMREEIYVGEFDNPEAAIDAVTSRMEALGWEVYR